MRVKDALDLLVAGVPESETLATILFSESGDIRACLEYAAEQVDHPVILAV